MAVVADRRIEPMDQAVDIDPVLTRPAGGQGGRGGRGGRRRRCALGKLVGKVDVHSIHRKKVVGRAREGFESAVREIVRRHLCGAAVEFSLRPSEKGAYLSITATFTATSREQLDALYRELNAHELVVMTL